MYKAALVMTDIEIGRHIIEALVGAGIEIVGALWLYMPQTEEHRLVIATPLVDSKGPRGAYGQVWTILTRQGLLSGFPMRRISLVSPKDPLIMALRRNLRPRPHGADLQLSETYIGNQYVEAGYVYGLDAS